jgi:hypothetical protein
MTHTAAALALVSALAAMPALADPARPPAASPAAPVSLHVPVPNPPPSIPVVATDATLDGRDPAGSHALQPNANPSALLFFTIMSSGGSGRYGR